MKTKGIMNKGFDRWAFLDMINSLLDGPVCVRLDETWVHDGVRVISTPKCE